MAKNVKGGDKIAKALNDINKMLEKGSTVEVGIPSTAVYPDGTSVAMVGTVHEYGAPKAGVPPRPFMRPTVTKNAKDWPKMLALALKANNMDGKKALALMGEIITGQIRQSIIDVKSPKLKKATIKAKGGRTKPLIDTDQMLDSIDYEVKAKK